MDPSTTQSYYDSITNSTNDQATDRLFENATLYMSTMDTPSITDSTAENATNNGTNSAISNGSTGVYSLSWDDATWILTSSFIIFTMQTGFGLIESGAVRSKNEVNIMVKNAIDVVFGGITYWMVGYGLTFGMDPGTNPFCGVGYWFVESSDPLKMGQVYSTFIFQLSFATTATTIVSGAMAERTHLRSYIVFSLLNTVIYCIPAHWLWAENGFLRTLGVIDIAGSGAVHLVGASSAFVAAWILGPRIGRYEAGWDLHAGNGTNTLIGMFMLWWGWLAFNSGSTFGISGGKWILAARTAVTTLNASMGGGIAGIIYTTTRTRGKVLIADLANSILGSLVSVTASCALIQPWEAVVIGFIGGLMCAAFPLVMDFIKVDDPVCAVAVHGVGGLWGMLAAGIFVDIDKIESFGGDSRGIIHGGGFRLLGLQTLACACLMVWSMSVTFVMLFAIDRSMGLRLSPEEEEIGSDLLEHRIGETTENENSTIEELLRIHIGRERRSSHTFFGFRRTSDPLRVSMSSPNNTVTRRNISRIEDTHYTIDEEEHDTSTSNADVRNIHLNGFTNHGLEPENADKIV